MGFVSLKNVIGQMSVALDAVEAELLGATPFHSKRVAVFCLRIGKLLGYDQERLFDLAGCALLHDNALTEYILSERPNSSRELNLRTHCLLGEDNCRFLPFPRPVDGFVLYHHERADGAGIFGKTQSEFPEEAGIIALADQVDVRFRLQTLDPLRLEKARGFVLGGAGTRFSTRTAKAALEVMDQTLVDDLSDEAIFGTLEAEMPPLDGEMTNRQLVNLSGIMARIIDYKSAFTRMHTAQIADKAWYMGGVYGFDETLRAQVYLAAALHDVGKLFIPTEILEKPGHLTQEEFEEIKKHVLYTWELLEPITGLEDIARWASNHHEKLDGSGYPFGRTAGELDFISRLLACLDIYQAVREARPYHPMRTHEETMQIVGGMARRGQIDPDITSDLDRELAKLPDGVAPPPETLEVRTRPRQTA